MMVMSTLTQGELASAGPPVADACEGIESTPGVCGGAACVGNTRIPVWLLEDYRRQGATDLELLESYPTLNSRDLANAWAYADAHRIEIAAAIEEDERA